MCKDKANIPPPKKKATEVKGELVLNGHTGWRSAELNKKGGYEYKLNMTWG